MEQRRNASLSRSLRLVMTALFAAMTCMATMVLMIPTPTGGYVNLGNTVVLSGAFLLGPVCGAVAGGIGGALADLLTGYVAYAPATLVIKALMAGAAGGLWLIRKQRRKTRLILCGAVAETIMAVGYWLYDGLLLRSLAGAAMGIPPNLVQGLFAVAASVLLIAVLEKVLGIHRIFPKG